MTKIRKNKLSSGEKRVKSEQHCARHDTSHSAELFGKIWERETEDRIDLTPISVCEVGSDGSLYCHLTRAVYRGEGAGFHVTI